MVTDSPWMRGSSSRLPCQMVFRRTWELAPPAQEEIPWSVKKAYSSPAQSEARVSPYGSPLPPYT